MLTYYLFRLGSFVVPYIPAWLGFKVCDFLSLLVYLLLPHKRKVILCNLSHVLPDASLSQRSKYSRGMVKNNIKNYFDLFRAHKLSQAQFEAVIQVEGLENVREAEKRGKGIVAFSGHTGSFSFVSQLATSVDINFNLTVEPIKPPQLFELVRQLREVDPKCKLISIAGSELRNVFRALKRNEMVCLAIDRDVTGNGLPQEFFGAEAKLPTGAAEIALRTGASLMSVYTYRKPDNQYVLCFGRSFVIENTGNREADVKCGNAKLLREVEKLILRDPNQWVVLQPVWDDCL